MISQLDIHGLFGQRDIKLVFDKRSLIITGDNGNGKTTILNILYNTLIGDIYELKNYEFQSINIYFKREYRDIHRIVVKKNKSKEDQNIKISYFFQDNTIIINCLENLLTGKIEISENSSDFNSMHPLEVGDTLYSYYKKIDNKIIYPKLKKLNESLLYFPTYRRIDIDIEQYFDFPFDLTFDSLFKRHQKNKNYSNFSKKDRRVVGISNSDIKDILSSYSKEISEVTSENLDKLLKSFVKNFITSIMDDTNGITISASDTGKKEDILKRLININQLLELDINEKYLEEVSELYYQQNEQAKTFIENQQKSGSTEDKTRNIRLKELLDIFNNKKQWAEYLSILEREYEDYQVKLDEELSSFKYISDNISDFSGNKIKLVRKKNNELVLEKRGEPVEFSTLSTGEKQLITFLVYCAIHIPKKTPALVIIDEPELSLHVKWQNKLLINLLAKNNINIFSATHSPYILNKELDGTTARLVDFD